MKQAFRFFSFILITILFVAACSNNSTADKEAADNTDISETADISDITDTANSSDITDAAENDLSTTPEDEQKEDTETMNTEDVNLTEPFEDGEHFIKTTFISNALLLAKDGSSNEKKLYIYLPPNYYKTNKNYPVIYYFHGFGDPMDFISNNIKALEKNMLLPENKEFIVVEVDGSRASRSEGSFWVNSPVTGLWEEYIIDEIVPYIDENYRTIAKAEARGIAGFSMGGFASLNLALAHPDIFSSTISFCPGVLKKGSLQLAMDSWKGDGVFLRCYGQAFAPNEENDKMCDIPTLDGSAEDNIIVEKWENGFGNFDQKLDNYLAKNIPLKAIQVVYGTYDFYKWIVEGCEDLSELMTAKGIEHTLTKLQVGHTQPPEFIGKYIVPFFSTNLVFNE